MVIMALDHARMYFGQGQLFANPTDLTAASPLLFFTRWITHFCAPVFVFLSGTAAYLYGTRHTKRELSRFLLTRGLWLILVETTIVTLGWTFDLTFGHIILQVIWAIGISMVCLAGFVYLPNWIVLAFGLLVALGHNVLDSFEVHGTSLPDLLWYTLHQPGGVQLTSHLTVGFQYPVLPWIALMSLGYLFGKLYRTEVEPGVRKRWLIGLGAGSILLFIALRGALVLHRGATPGLPDGAFYQLLNFVNVTKYPPSVFFLLMTMGPAFLFLAYIEKVKNRWTDALIVYGKTPFLYYILHIYLLHALSLAVIALTGGTPAGFEFGADNFTTPLMNDPRIVLTAIYLAWISVVLVLYPVCKRYGVYKSQHREKWWLSYL